MTAETNTGQKTTGDKLFIGGGAGGAGGRKTGSGRLVLTGAVSLVTFTGTGRGAGRVVLLTPPVLRLLSPPPLALCSGTGAGLLPTLPPPLPPLEPVLPPVLGGV